MEWKGVIHHKTGYGRIRVNNAYWYVHRYVAFYSQIQHPGWRDYLLSQRTIMVCHTCDNPPCINPAHLEIATAQYNTLDSITKGRRAHLDADYDILSIDILKGLQKSLNSLQ